MERLCDVLFFSSDSLPVSSQVDSETTQEQRKRKKEKEIFNKSCHLSQFKIYQMKSL